MLLAICMILFCIVCALLILMVIIQPAQGDGLAGAFGGAGSDTFFGTKAGQHINRFTLGLGVIFIFLAIAIGFLQKGVVGKESAGGSIMENLPKSEAPAPAKPQDEAPK